MEPTDAVIGTRGQEAATTLMPVLRLNNVSIEELCLDAA